MALITQVKNNAKRPLTMIGIGAGGDPRDGAAFKRSAENARNFMKSEV